MPSNGSSLHSKATAAGSRTTASPMQRQLFSSPGHWSKRNSTRIRMRRRVSGTKPQAAVHRALDWANHSAAAVHDPYANAIRLELARSQHEAPLVQRYHDELVSSAERDRNGAHWLRGGQLPFYGWGRAGDMETTAMAFAALRAENIAADQALLNNALYFLLGGRDEFGIWYSGQATVRGLKALLPIAEEEIAATGDAELRLNVNGTALDSGVGHEPPNSAHLLNAPRTIDLTSLLKPGHNTISFTGNGDAALASAEATARFTLPGLPRRQAKRPRQQLARITDWTSITAARQTA